MEEGSSLVGQSGISGPFKGKEEIILQDVSLDLA